MSCIRWSGARSLPGTLYLWLVLSGCPVGLLCAQPPAGGPGGGPGGGPQSADRPLVAEFDTDGDGVLNAVERRAARTELEADAERRPRGRRRGREMEPGRPGVRLQPQDVEIWPDRPLYDPGIVRTLFLEFDDDDWEQELEIFKPTDVEIPATLTVDGVTYPNVGVSFRGASSFFMVPASRKRSLNLSLDLVDPDQRLYGYKSLNLLNGNGDSSLMSSALYSRVSGMQIPTPRVNYVRVVINGESWGLYVSSQQFNKIFTREFFDTGKGARWKVSGSPRGDGGLRYLGEDTQPYRDRFEIKSADKPESWRDLIALCRLLNETPLEDLPETLEPVLDIDGALWFLAVDNALSNSDGYWTRASDYNIYQDPDGKFHMLPHDMNEAFRLARRRGGGPGGPPPPPRGARGGQRPPGGEPPRGDARQGGPPPLKPRGGGGGGTGRGGGPTLDPLVGLDDPGKPLRSRLLQHPDLQRQYLENVRTIAEWLQWDNLGPQVRGIRELIEDDVAADTRMLTTLEAFQRATGGSPSDGLRAFATQRAEFLLNHPAIRQLPAAQDRR